MGVYGHLLLVWMGEVVMVGACAAFVAFIAWFEYVVWQYSWESYSGGWLKAPARKALHFQSKPLTHIASL